MGAQTSTQAVTDLSADFETYTLDELRKTYAQHYFVPQVELYCWRNQCPAELAIRIWRPDIAESYQLVMATSDLNIYQGPLGLALKVKTLDTYTGPALIFK